MFENDNFILTIDEDNMTARMSLRAPLNADRDITVENIEGFLKENGIKTGIDTVAINKMLDENDFNSSYEVAKGKRPVAGNDGYYEYFVELEDSKAKPVINSDGTVDYYNSLKLAMVREGDVIARYIPPTSGEYGFDVLAKMVQPARGREIKPLRGKGLVFDEEKKEYKAAYEGRIYLNDERIMIDKVYVVDGDLDIEQGNIVFTGDVEVKGDVRSGLEIVTDGSVFIRGHAGGCKITAGGNVTIKNGIQGKNKCYIVSDGDVAGSFMERCTIKAKGNVYADYMLDCNVSAGAKVIVSSKQGLVLGGTISGTQGIIVREAGNKAETTTILQAGVVKELLEKIARLVEKHHKISIDVEQLTQHLAMYDGLKPEQITPEIDEIKKKIMRAKVIKVSEKNETHDAIAKLNDEVNMARSDASVTITGKVYPGVKVNLAHFWYEQKESCIGIEYKIKNDAIEAKGL